VQGFGDLIVGQLFATELSPRFHFAGFYVRATADARLFAGADGLARFSAGSPARVVFTVGSLV
jgi:hypothetical protein